MNIIKKVIKALLRLLKVKRSNGIPLENIYYIILFSKRLFTTISVCNNSYTGNWKTMELNGMIASLFMAVIMIIGPQRDLN